MLGFRVKVAHLLKDIILSFSSSRKISVGSKNYLCSGEVRELTFVGLGAEFSGTPRD